MMNLATLERWQAWAGAIAAALFILVLWKQGKLRLS